MNLYNCLYVLVVLLWGNLTLTRLTVNTITPSDACSSVGVTALNCPYVCKCNLAFWVTNSFENDPQLGDLKEQVIHRRIPTTETFTICSQCGLLII